MRKENARTIVLKQMKMHDPRKKSQKLSAIPEREWRPSFNLNTKQFPELADKKLNDQFNVLCTVKVMSLNQHNEEPKNFGLDIMKIGVAK